MIAYLDCNEDIVLNSVNLTHRKPDGKQFSIGGRAILSRTQSTDAIITRDINLRELENAETRGVHNKTFSEIYEEHDGHPNDLEDGSFMVDNPQLALKKHDLEYMKEVRRDRFMSWHKWMIPVINFDLDRKNKIHRYS